MTLQTYGGLPNPESVPLLCHSQNKAFNGLINRQQNDSEKLANLVGEKGEMGGLKAYFKAYVDQTAQQLVIVPAVLSGLDW